MDWNTLAALSQVIGAIGVIASLIYVGRQVKLSNALARAEAYRIVSLRVSEITSEWAGDKEFLPVARAVLFERKTMKDLPPDDQMRVLFHFSSALRVFEMIHRQVEAGVLGPDAYDILGALMFRTPVFSDVWQRMRAAYAEDFARLIEARFSPTLSSTE